MNTFIKFASKSNNSKKDKLGNPILKTRIWLEESKGNRFLSDNGFSRGTRYDLIISDSREPIITLIANPNGKYKVAGKDDRALIDITRNANQLPVGFAPENNDGLIAEFFVNPVRPRIFSIKTIYDERLHPENHVHDHGYIMGVSDCSCDP